MAKRLDKGLKPPGGPAEGRALTWTCEHTLEGHSDGVQALAVVGSSHVVSGSNADSIKVWSTVSWTCERTLQGHTGYYYVKSLAVLGSINFVSASHRIIARRGTSTIKESTIQVWSPHQKRIEYSDSDSNSDSDSESESDSDSDSDSDSHSHSDSDSDSGQSRTGRT